MKKVLLLTTAVFMLLATVSAIVLDVSPNENGTLDVMVAHNWYWTGSLFSGISFAYLNPLSITEEENLYSALSGTAAELSVDVLGYRFPGAFSAEVALNVLYNPNDLKEVGYVDSGSTRFFLVNERTINLLLPRIKGGVSGTTGRSGGLRFGLNAEFAPWFPVFFAQSLSVSTSGPREEKTTASTGYGAMAWAASGNAALRSPVASVLLEGGIDWVPVRYTYLDYSLTESTLDSLMVNFNFYGGLALHFIKLGDASPRVMVGLEKETVTNQADGSKLVGDTKVRFKFGLGL